MTTMKIKHPNGGWRIKATGPDDTPAHPYANRVADNATRKGSKPAVHNTRHSSHGTSTNSGTTCCDDGSMN